MLNDRNYALKNYRPILHFTSEKNWINDPNGFGFFDGKYHLFYQYNYLGIVWGNMSWGHAVSKDLVHWEHLDVALYPDKPYDEGGVFSGSAIVLNNVHTLYYTGVKQVEKMFEQVQCIATSKDGITYEKYVDNPILEADEHGDKYDFRDPKIWIEDKKIYMIVTTNINKKGVANVYTSTNGVDFEYITTFAKENTGFMWECPDLFMVQEQWMLIFSAMGMKDEIVENITYIAPVKFDYNSKETYVYEHEKMDYGVDFYAPQTMKDNLGRRIVIAWLRMHAPLSDTQNWVGMMTLPREIKFIDQEISYQIIEEIFINKKIVYKMNEIQGLEEKDIEEANENVNENANSSENSLMKQFDLKNNTSYEITTSFDTDISFDVSNGKNGGLHIEYNPDKRTVIVMRSSVGNQEADKRRETEIFYSPKLQTEHIDLQIIIDISVAEIFINKGRYVISTVFSNACSENILRINSSKSLNTLEIAELQSNVVI